MKFKRTLFILTTIIWLISCQSNHTTDEQTEEEIVYSFFVAGHAYGHPMYHHYGLHPPFVNHFNFVNHYPKNQFGVLTGDIVRKPTQLYWDSTRFDINKINVPIHIAAGNHDRGQIFDSLYQSYYSFESHQDLFIILSPTNWNIVGDQMDFLKNTLKTKSKNIQNIFIFSHELVWWEPDNIFKNIIINYEPHYPGKSNYWEEVHPIFDTIDNPIYWFAGDVGCTDVVTPYMYHNSKNVHFIASGMGGYRNDNLIFVEVSSTGEVDLKLYGLNTDTISEITDLESFVLP